MAEKPTMKTGALWFCRLLLSGIFAYAAAQKIRDPASFASDVDHIRLLPYPLPLLVGLYLPWIELICSASLLVRRLERGALVLIAVMCGSFFVALTSAWLRGLDISCGCFGHSAATAALPWAIARSLVLGLLSCYLLRGRLRR